jgi:hypothetical protein
MRKPAQVGDAVTVVYDPDEPAHVRTTEEPNENQILVGFSVIRCCPASPGPRKPGPHAVPACAAEPRVDWSRR